MKKKLPSVFVKRQDKKINNNKETYYSKENDIEIRHNSKTETFLTELMIQKKIDEIFSSTKFIYKIKVLLLTEEGEAKETIIAKLNNDLITINNKKIKISDIKNIKII